MTNDGYPHQNLYKHVYKYVSIFFQDPNNMQYLFLTVVIRVFHFSKFNISANVALTVTLITLPQQKFKFG